MAFTPTVTRGVSKPSQTSKTELFVKNGNNFLPLTISPKGPILDILLGSEYALPT